MIQWQKPDRRVRLAPLFLTALLVLDSQDSQDGVEDGPLRIVNRALGGVKQGKDEQHIKSLINADIQ